MTKGKQPQYEIREATLADVEAIRTMHGQSWRDSYRNDERGVTEEWLVQETLRWLTPEEIKRSHEKLEGVFSDPSQFYRVASSGNEIVGYLHLKTKDNGTKHLGALYTSKSTHGTGLAQQLMACADEWIDGKTVDLEVVSYNERAKAFYRKCGFVETGEKNELFLDKMPVTVMVRKGNDD